MKKALLLPFLFLLLQVQAQDGTLDQTFGAGGLVHLGQSFDHTAFAPDGKLVGVKAIPGGFAVYRYTTEGTPDASFGNNGVQTLTLPEFTGVTSVLVATMNDNRIVVQVHGNTADSEKLLIALVRFQSDGMLDPTFGIGGISKEFMEVHTSARPDDFYPRLAAMHVQSDGKIITVFNVGKYRVNVAQVRRYNTDGILDVSFGSFVFGNANGGRYIYNILLALGKNDEVAVGYTSIGFSPTPQVFSIVRLNNNGNLEGEFTYGHTDLPPQSEVANALAVQDDGKVLVMSLAKLLRFGTDNRLDETFGTGGIVTPSFAVKKILPQANGKIIVGGGSGGNFVLARYNPDGTLDPSFGSGGITTSDFGGNEAIYNMGMAGNRLYAYDGVDSDVLAAYRVNASNTPCENPPTLRNDLTIVLDADCAGNGGLITLIPTSGTAPFQYSMNGGVTYVSGPATGYSFQGLTAGTYQLRIKDANGCESAVLTKEVRKYYGGPLFKNDGTIVLDASCGANDGNISIIPTCGAAPFMYSIDGGMTYVEGPATGYTFQNLAPGTYQLRLKDAYGTESAIVTRQVRPDFYGTCAVNSVARPGGKAAQTRDGAATLRAYPNPSRGKFQVQLGRFSSPRVQLQVVDARGSVLQQRTLNAEQTSVVDIDLSGKAKGLFLIRIVSDKGTQQTKVMIQ